MSATNHLRNNERNELKGMRIMTLIAGNMYRIAYNLENRSLRGIAVIFRGIVQDRLSAFGAPSAMIETLNGEQYRIRVGALIAL